MRQLSSASLTALWGESVKAIVVLKNGETMGEEEVIEYCKNHLASYKKPK